MNTPTTFRRNNRCHLRAWLKYHRRMAGSHHTDAYPRGEQEILEEFLQSLDKSDRSVFRLYLSNIPYHDMAGLMAESETSLRENISRIRRMFYERYIRK